MEVRKIVKDTLILFTITLISGLVLGFAYEVTKGPIEAREAEEKKAAYQSVFPEADSFAESERIEAYVENADELLSQAGISGVTVDECLEARDSGGNVLGYVMSLSFAGSQAQMTMAYGWSNDGATKGIDILVSAETLNLGSLVDEPEFKSQFEMVQADEFVLNGNVDQISGATITSEAVVNAANAGMAFAGICAKGE